MIKHEASDFSIGDKVTLDLAEMWDDQSNIIHATVEGFMPSMGNINLVLIKTEDGEYLWADVRTQLRHAGGNYEPED